MQEGLIETEIQPFCEILFPTSDPITMKLIHTKMVTKTVTTTKFFWQNVGFFGFFNLLNPPLSS